MRGLRRSLQTLVFLAVMAGGLAVIVRDGAGSAIEGRLEAPAWDSIVDGRLAKAVDTAVAAAMPRSTWLDGWAAGVGYRVLAETGPQVRAGCPGWLFLAEELVDVPDGMRHLTTRGRLARRIAADLAARGVALVTIAVPDKAAIADEGKCGLRAGDQAQVRARAWRWVSARVPLHPVDLSEGWPMPGYWRTDTHWDRRGAGFASERTAGVLAALIGAGEDEVRLQAEGGEVDRVGDLTRLAGLDHAPAWLRPPPDREQVMTASVVRSGGLLDEVSGPSVILAGSSYSLNSGFIDLLQHASSREVAQRSLAGGGFAGALLKLLDAGPIPEGVRAVVWEFPMRALTQPLSDAERRYLGEDHAD